MRSMVEGPPLQTADCSPAAAFKSRSRNAFSLAAVAIFSPFRSVT